MSVMYWKEAANYSSNYWLLIYLVSAKIKTSTFSDISLNGQFLASSIYKKVKCAFTKQQ